MLLQEGNKKVSFKEPVAEEADFSFEGLFGGIEGKDKEKSTGKGNLPPAPLPPLPKKRGLLPGARGKPPDSR